MVSDLNSKIQQFNQMALERELTSSLIIKHQLQAMFADFESRFPNSEQAVRIQTEIMRAVDDSIKGMLHAENKEVFSLQSERLKKLVGQLKEKFGLQDKEAEAALSHYRFMRSILRALNEIDYEKREQCLNTLPEWCKTYPEYDAWATRLHTLQQSSESDFEQQKTQIMADILKEIHEKKLDSLSSLALVEENIKLLNETRLAYLEESKSRSKLIKSIGWVGLGVLLTVGAAVLALAFPVVAIPGIIVGSIVVGYGTIDFSNKGAKFYLDARTVPIGSRQENEQTKAHLQELADKLGMPDFLAKQQLQEKKQSNEKKWVKRLGMAASLTGLVLGIAALAVALPFVGVPLVAVIVIAVASLAIAALTTSFLGYKMHKQKTEWQQTEQGIQQQMTEDNKLIDEISLQDHARMQLSSTAKVIMDEEIVSEQLQEHSTAKPAPEPEPEPTAQMEMKPMVTSDDVAIPVGKDLEREIEHVYPNTESIFSSRKNKSVTNRDTASDNPDDRDEDEMNETL